MKIYTVHAKSGVEGKYHSPVFVREGFNWHAFVLTLFWALYHKLWKPAAIIIAFQLFLELLAYWEAVSFLSMCAMQLGFNVLVGFQANDWLRAKLRARGMLVVDIVAADSLMRAELRYLERYTNQSVTTA
jgi:hypothetical protein